MNYRKDKLTFNGEGEGQRFCRTDKMREHDSLNLAKKANGLNARTCEKVPPHIDELHAEALEIDAELAKQPEAA